MVVLDDAVTRRALAAARSLAQWGDVRAVYVFGSHAEGRADRWSDLDVAAFVEGVETWDLRRRAQAMARAQRDAGLDVEAHLFPASALDHPDPASFAGHVQRHGVRVLGDMNAA
jgi:predicted nucleotidyltransferase